MRSRLCRTIGVPCQGLPNMQKVYIFGDVVTTPNDPALWQTTCTFYGHAVYTLNIAFSVQQHYSPKSWLTATDTAAMLLYNSVSLLSLGNDSWLFFFQATIMQERCVGIPNVQCLPSLYVCTNMLALLHIMYGCCMHFATKRCMRAKGTGE